MSPTQCPALGSPQAPDSDAPAGPGTVSAVRAASAPQPARSTGEQSPLTSLQITPPVARSCHQLGWLAGFFRKPRPLECAPITFTPAHLLSLYTILSYGFFPWAPPLSLVPALPLVSHWPGLSMTAPYWPPQFLERWWQPLLDPLRACLTLGPRALPDGFPLHADILG